ncbi:hypothetical protein [Nannocystis pusilla]|uniref:hypothetical protein n=1 Tax=Nannocystis pusilla TaxID=889268 RepID=UPI003B7B710B
MASIRGALAYCRLDPANDLVLLPTDDGERVELTIIGDVTVTVAVLAVHELGQREEVWTDEPPRAALRSPVHSPPPPPRRTEVAASFQATPPAPANSILGIQVHRPAPISCRCKVSVDVLERIRFRAQQIADLQPMSLNDPTGWSKKLRRELVEGIVVLAARGRDIRGVGRELRHAMEKALGYRLTGGSRSFRYAIAAYRLYSRFVRQEGRQTVFAFSDLLRPDSDLMRWLLGSLGSPDAGTDRVEPTDAFVDSGSQDSGDDAELDEATNEDADAQDGDGQDVTDPDAGEEEAEDDPPGGGLEAFRHMLPPKPKFLYYTPKYHVDIFEKDRQLRQMFDAARKKRKKNSPS